MIRSMTGYAFVEESTDERDIGIEIKSVNNRYLEIYSSLPSFLAPLEAEIRGIVSERALRGKVEVSIRFREYTDTVAIHVDQSAVRAATDALGEIARTAGLERSPSYGDILSFEGVVHTERKRDLDLYRTLLFPLLTRGLDQWDETRRNEGAATVKDIEASIGRLDAAVQVFTEKAPEVERIVVETVREKFREILGDDVEEQRVIAEAAALAIKHGTNEEQVRLKTHITSLRELLRRGGSIGKRLDFICQEVNREVNTTGSKTILPDVQAAVIEAKDAVEAIREQVRNIE